MRISDWSSDVCSSDLRAREPVHQQEGATSLAGLEDHELGGPVGGGVAGDGDGAGGGQPRAPIPKPPMTSARGVVSSSAGTSMSMSAPSSNISIVMIAEASPATAPARKSVGQGKSLSIR